MLVIQLLVMLDKLAQWRPPHRLGIIVYINRLVREEVTLMQEQKFQIQQHLNIQMQKM